MQGVHSLRTLYKFQGAFQRRQNGGQERAQDQSCRQRRPRREANVTPFRPVRSASSPMGEGQQIDASPEGPAVVPVSHGRSRRVGPQNQPHQKIR